MKIKLGEEYDGPGKADPSKSRAEREAEFCSLLNSDNGRAIVNYLFLTYTGALEGTIPQIGASELQTILAHEYPNG